MESQLPGITTPSYQIRKIGLKWGEWTAISSRIYTFLVDIRDCRYTIQQYFNTVGIQKLNAGSQLDIIRRTVAEVNQTRVRRVLIY